MSSEQKIKIKKNKNTLLQPADVAALMLDTQSNTLRMI
jgi:hypothetical protein